MNAFTSTLTTAPTTPTVPTPNTIALLGDSITNFNSDLVQFYPSRYYSNGGFYTYAAALNRYALTQVKRSPSEWEFGGSGQTSSDVLANGQAAAAAASGAGWATVLLGTNDVSGSFPLVTTQANLTAIYGMLRAAGITVIACTLPPRNDSSITVAQLDKTRAINRWIRATVRATPGMVLCDFYPALVVPSTGKFDANYCLSDGVHPNPLGAMRMGSVLGAVLNRIVQPADDLPADALDALNLLGSKGAMLGATGSVSGTNVTGTTATGWTTYSNNGTPTAVLSKVARTDIPGEWQQIAVSAAVLNTESMLHTTTATGWAVGDTVYASVEFQTDPASWSVRQLQMRLVTSGNVITGWPNWGSGDRTAFPTGQSWVQFGSGIFRTPELPIPAGTTTLTIEVSFFGTGTLRVGRAGIYKV